MATLKKALAERMLTSFSDRAEPRAIPESRYSETSLSH
jgi:hypothetical protein